VTPVHRLDKLCGSLSRIAQAISDGNTPKSAIRDEAQAIRDAEGMGPAETTRFRGLLTECMLLADWNRARKRAERSGSNEDPAEEEITWP